jgi:TolA-binding protein
MSMLSAVTQKMNQLRLEADESAVKVDELQNKVKVLEQENLSKEQEITSLQHKNGLLEGEVEKLETAINDFKKAAEDGTQHSTTNESLNRRLQLLEEEAEEADKTLREANEKWVAQYYTFQSHDYLTWRCLPHCPFFLCFSDTALPCPKLAFTPANHAQSSIQARLTLFFPLSF